MRPPRGYIWVRATIQKGKGAQEVLGQREVKEGLMCLGGAAQQSAQLKSSKGSSSLGFLQLRSLSYLLLAEVGYHFGECAKQAGSEVLKICLLGSCLKQLDV